MLGSTLPPLELNFSGIFNEYSETAELNQDSLPFPIFQTPSQQPTTNFHSVVSYNSSRNASLTDVFKKTTPSSPTPTLQSDLLVTKLSQEEKEPTQADIIEKHLKRASDYYDNETIDLFKHIIELFAKHNCDMDNSYYPNFSFHQVSLEIFSQVLSQVKRYLNKNYQGDLPVFKISKNTVGIDFEYGKSFIDSVDDSFCEDKCLTLPNKVKITWKMFLNLFSIPKDQANILFFYLLMCVSKKTFIANYKKFLNLLNTKTLFDNTQIKLNTASFYPLLAFLNMELSFERFIELHYVLNMHKELEDRSYNLLKFFLSPPDLALGYHPPESCEVQLSLQLNEGPLSFTNFSHSQVIQPLPFIRKLALFFTIKNAIKNPDAPGSYFETPQPVGIIKPKKEVVRSKYDVDNFVRYVVSTVFSELPEEKKTKGTQESKEIEDPEDVLESELEKNLELLDLNLGELDMNLFEEVTY